MKLTRFSLLTVGLFCVLTGLAHAQPTPLPPMNLGAAPATGPDREELSLAVGTYLGRYDTNYVENSFGMDLRTDLDNAKMLEGFSNFLANPDKAMPWIQVTNILSRQIAYLKDKAVQDSNAMIAAGPEYKAKSEKFMNDNATAPGVTRLTNGVEYKVIKDGDGVVAGVNDLITLTLTAKLIDGPEIGTIPHRELPVANTRPLPAVLSSIFTTMKAGSHWIIYVPYDLAYGDKPAMPSALHAPKVPPYSVVVFDVEIEGVRPAPPQAAPATPPPTAMPPRGAMPPPAAVNPGPPIMHPVPAPAQASSDIVRVPSTEELKRGSNIEVMTLDQAIKRSQATATNNTGTNNP